MRIQKLVVVLSACALTLFPAHGDVSDLEVGLVGHSGSTVTVSVHNPNGSSESARINFAVLFTDGTTQSVTSNVVTVPAGASASLTVSTTQPVTEVIDDPEPILP